MYSFKTNKKEIHVQSLDMLDAIDQAKAYCFGDELDSLRLIAGVQNLSMISKKLLSY